MGIKKSLDNTIAFEKAINKPIDKAINKIDKFTRDSKKISSRISKLGSILSGETSLVGIVGDKIKEWITSLLDDNFDKDNYQYEKRKEDFLKEYEKEDFGERHIAILKCDKKNLSKEDFELSMELRKVIDRLEENYTDQDTTKLYQLIEKITKKNIEESEALCICMMKVQGINFLEPEKGNHENQGEALQKCFIKLIGKDEFDKLLRKSKTETFSKLTRKLEEINFGL